MDLMTDHSALSTEPSGVSRRGKSSAVIPAYNAEATLAKTVADIPPGAVDEMLVVDDASRDRTVEIAKSLGLAVVVRPTNGGYGANQKTCYDEALARGAVSQPSEPRMLRVAKQSGGARTPWKEETAPPQAGLQGLTLVENTVLGQNLGEFHSGFRAYSRRVLETIPYHQNSNDIVFDQQFLVQAVHFGFRLGDVPVPVRSMADASSISFRRSVTYGTQTLLTLVRWFTHRMGLRRDPLFSREP